MVNSGFLDGMDIHAATEKMMDYMEEHGYGKRVVNFKLRDWVFSAASCAAKG
jgi:leucyl-tRNA synthetase